MLIQWYYTLLTRPSAQYLLLSINVHIYLGDGMPLEIVNYSDKCDGPYNLAYLALINYVLKSYCAFRFLFRRNRHLNAGLQEGRNNILDKVRGQYV